MKIQTKVFIKQVITEKSKETLHQKFLDAKTRLEQECQQLLFEQRKLQYKKHSSGFKAENRFQSEIHKRQQKMEEIDFKIEQLDILAVGSEITEKQVDALVEVEVGMRWDDIMNDRAIIIEDGVIIRIDEVG